MEHGIELELVKMTRSIIFRFNSISTRVIILKWTGSFCHILEDFTQPWFAKYNQHIIQCFVKSMVNCKPRTPQNGTTVPGHLSWFLERARPRSYTERLVRYEVVLRRPDQTYIWVEKKYFFTRQTLESLKI